MTSGWTVEPVFSIRLHDKDLNVLHIIQQFFGVGKVYHHVSINEATFRVSSIEELDVIVNHFEKYPLLTQKLSDFLLVPTPFNGDIPVEGGDLKKSWR